jgi:glyoxylase-like metal-dependent hydrolase (beta-lactamase superfamily II)
MKLYSVESKRQKLDGGAMFGHVPKALWSQWVTCDEHNRVDLVCRCLLLKTATHTILFEAGIGPFMAPDLAERYGIQGQGDLLTHLKEKGVSEEGIDYVILSHLHFDHIGGLIPAWPGMEDPHWQPHFPNATYVVGKVQYERAACPHLRDRASYVSELTEKLRQTGRLVLVDSESPGIAELNDHMRFRFTEGHTPGSMHAIIRGEQETVFFAADLIPGTPWLHLPIATGYDRYPEQSINEKKTILEQAVKENWLVFYTHDVQVSASRVAMNEKDNYQVNAPMDVLDEFNL